MKKIMTLVAFLLTVQAQAFFGGEGLGKVACDHLKDINIVCHNLKLQLETKSSQFFISTFAGGTDEFPCHVGVVVDKASKTVSTGASDRELNINFPYSDVLPKLGQKIYWICAD